MNRTVAPRLLIVDDDELVGRTIQMMARREGVEVRVTCDPNRFLELVEEWQPGIVAIDLAMPEMDGMQVLKELARRGCRAHVIVTSGLGHRVLEAAGRSAREHGLPIAGVLPKPFVSADVRGLLNNCIASPVLSDHPEQTGGLDHFSVNLDVLEQALKARQFFVVYQPTVHCLDGKLAGVEALVRWRHPEHGVIPPGRFISLFETSEMMGELTGQVIDLALQWFSGLRLPDEAERPITLSVNISARCLEDTALVDRLARRCRRYGVDPSRLIFELTETSAMQDRVDSLELLTRLRVMGFQLSIDDFGTGFSSMLQLVRLPFSEVKIDRSFVMSAEGSEESRKVIKSITELGKSLGLKTVAEGVESKWAKDYLRSIGCDFCQGYFIGRPAGGEVVREKWGL